MRGQNQQGMGMDQAAATATASGKGLWTLWRTYLLRWLVFGAIAGLAQPVVGNFDSFWVQKLYQMLGGLPFGLACFAAFTPLQNWANTPRVRWKSWLTVIGTWMVMKFIFVGALMALGIA
jgi:hypothetical protein